MATKRHPIVTLFVATWIIAGAGLELIVYAGAIWLVWMAPDWVALLAFPVIIGFAFLWFVAGALACLCRR